jgi:hypothetical protein
MAPDMWEEASEDARMSVHLPLDNEQARRPALTNRKSKRSLMEVLTGRNKAERLGKYSSLPIGSFVLLFVASLFA